MPQTITWFDTITLHQDTGPGINDVSGEVKNMIPMHANGSWKSPLPGMVMAIPTLPGIIVPAKSNLPKLLQM